MLALHKKDLAIVESVHNKLNRIGTINLSPSKDEARLAVNDRASLMLLASLFSNYPLRTSSQLSRFTFFKESLSDNIKLIELYNQYKSQLMLVITASDRLKSNSKLDALANNQEGLDN